MIISKSSWFDIRLAAEIMLEWETILTALSGFNDCHRFSKTRADALKVYSDVVKLVGTSNKENWGKVKKCLFYHCKILSSFENEIFVIM